MHKTIYVNKYEFVNKIQIVNKPYYVHKIVDINHIVDKNVRIWLECITIMLTNLCYVHECFEIVNEIVNKYNVVSNINT